MRYRWHSRDDGREGRGSRGGEAYDGHRAYSVTSARVKTLLSAADAGGTRMRYARREVTFARVGLSTPPRISQMHVRVTQGSRATHRTCERDGDIELNTPRDCMRSSEHGCHVSMGGRVCTGERRRASARLPTPSLRCTYGRGLRRPRSSRSMHRDVFALGRP